MLEIVPAPRHVVVLQQLFSEKWRSTQVPIIAHSVRMSMDQLFFPFLFFFFFFFFFDSRDDATAQLNNGKLAKQLFIFFLAPIESLFSPGKHYAYVLRV